MMRTLVQLFTKLPREGQVKTRLAVSIGDTQALTVYQQLLQYSFENVLRCCNQPTAHFECEHWITDKALGSSLKAEDCIAQYRYFLAAQEQFPVCVVENLSIKLQQGVTLGQRMAFSLQQGLRFYDAAMIIGGDCVEVTPEFLHQASALVVDAQAQGQALMVLQPAFDGGVVLIAANQLAASAIPLLADTSIAWGESTVYEQLTGLTAPYQVRCVSMTPAHDIDTLEDYKRWQKNCRPPLILS